MRTTLKSLLTALLACVLAISAMSHASAGVVVPTVRWAGAALPGIPTDLTGLNQLAGEIGRTPGVAMWYVGWSSNAAFPASGASAIVSNGSVPEITWEPWNASNGISQPTYSLRRITAGKFDSYIRQWASGVKAWGGPLRLRFAHEMNGNWYPWDEGVNDNAPGSYVTAWQHVHAIFDALHVTNVTWIWSPNVPYTGSTSLKSLYPGDNYVDEMALDGYNWSTLQPGSQWTSFHDVLATGLGQLAGINPTMPVTIGEVGCPEVGGDKAQWITDMWATLSGWTQVRGLMWFDYNKEADWRIDSSQGSLSAYTAGLGAYLSQ